MFPWPPDWKNWSFLAKMVLLVEDIMPAGYVMRYEGVYIYGVEVLRTL